jgi:hypothetical protein
LTAVPTLLADPPAAPAEQQPVAGSTGAPDAPQAAAPPAQQRGCANCAAPLAGDQDWCLQCGTGAPDSLRSHAPSWRSAAAVIGVLTVLVAGAATAAYAALSKGGGKARQATATVAQVPTPTAPTPTAATPVAPATPEASASAKVGTPTTIKPALPLGAVKPPNIPLPTVTPKTPSAISPSGSGGAGTPTTTTPKANNGAAPTTGETQPEAILLDTNAAATYNPYNYPASNFGDPSLAIDGDTSTGWTAVVEPTVAPKMAEGLIIDLNTPRKFAALALSTSTPGITVQVSAANGQAPPASITDPAWIALSPSRVIGKKHVRLKLGGTTAASKAAHRFVVVWLSQAPASSVGTPQAPGHVSLNELELFPVKK